MRLLGNLNYTLQMISEELNISPTQLCRYLDSYVTIDMWQPYKDVTRTYLPNAIVPRCKASDTGFLTVQNRFDEAVRIRF